MVGRLLERLKLVVAVSEEIPVEAKLHLQPMIQDMTSILSAPEAEQDQARVGGYYHSLLETSEDDPDVVALLSAVRNFVSYL
ncbi:MAG: hypothetical protein ACI8TX_001605 [Hyphomicrobiaceae bacterium]|jgi:hypothetical protein